MSSDAESSFNQDDYDDYDNEYNNNNDHRKRHNRSQSKPKKPRWFNDVFNDEVQEATNSPLFKLVRTWVTSNIGLDLSYVVWGITLLAAARKYSPSVPAWIEKNGTNSTTLNEHDPVARELLAWISQQPTSQLFAWIPSFQAFEWKNLSSNNRRNDADKVEETTKLTTTLHNTRFFFFQGKAFLLQRDATAYNRETITLRCLWGNQQPMIDLFQHVRKNTQHQKKELEIRFVTAGGVSPTNYVERKLMKHFDMEVGPKQALVNELQDFFDPRTEEYYHQNGTPYRKGLLLYGPPGTGKTSLSKAITGEYGLELIIFNLSDMTDALLMRRFDGLPKQCVVLFEDIDSMGIVRETTLPGQHQHDLKPQETSESEEEDDDEDQCSLSREYHDPSMYTGVGQHSRNAAQRRARQEKKDNRPKPRTKVTLSGLLNTIDGPGTKEGRLVIFTTNAPNGLDEALIRPGRVDKMIYLGFSSHQTSAITFKRVYITDHQNRLTEAEIERLAVEFGRRVPNKEFTTCKLNRYCMQMHRNQPQKAIDDLAEWIELQRKKKDQPFEYEINDAARSHEMAEADSTEETEEEFEFEQNQAEISIDTSYVELEPELASRGTPPEKFHRIDTKALKMSPVSLQYAGAAAMVGAAIAGLEKTFKGFFKSFEAQETGPIFYSPGFSRLNRYYSGHSRSSEPQQPYMKAPLDPRSEAISLDKYALDTSCSNPVEPNHLLLEDEETDSERVINTPSTGTSSSGLVASGSGSNIHSKFARYREPNHEDLQGRRNQHPYHGPIALPTKIATTTQLEEESEGTVLLRDRSPTPLDDDAEVLVLKHGGLSKEL